MGILCWVLIRLWILIPDSKAMGQRMGLIVGQPPYLRIQVCPEPWAIASLKEPEAKIDSRAPPNRTPFGAGREMTRYWDKAVMIGDLGARATGF
jgi:hypothetical protein